MYKLQKLPDGTHCAIMVGHPEVVCLWSYGSKKKALTYLANQYALSLDEYLVEKKRGRL